MSNLAWRRFCAAPWWLSASVLSLLVMTVGCTKPKPAGEGAQAPKYEVADDTPGDTKPVQSAALPSVGPVIAPAASGQPTADNQVPTADNQLSTAADAIPAAEGMQQPPAIPGDQLDTLAVPQGTPEELMKFVTQLGNRLISLQGQIRQGSATPAAMQPILEAMLEATNRVLAAEIDAAARKQAIEAKAGALLMLSQVAPNPSWNEQIREFAKSLAADKSPVIAIEGRTILLGMLVGEITQGRSQDVAGLMTQLKALLADEQRNIAVLDVTQQAFLALRKIGREEEAREAFSLIANAFKDHSDPQLATEADSMLEQLAVMDLQIETKLNDVVLKREGAVAAFTDAINQVLQRPNPGAIALERVGGCLPVLEQSGNYELAAKVCELIQTAYKNSTSPQVRDFAKQKTDLMMRRLNMLGKPLSVEGTLLDGAPLDFAPYQGKVVLLAFWASAAPSCKSELLTIKTLYEKYHANGLEVLGVCLDQDVAKANEFLADTQLPWANITNTKLAEQFGVEMIPYLLLADRQGNVVDLFVAGSTLDAKLANLLGVSPPATPPAAAAPVNELREPARETK
jgi:peroxiredoxin